ncbi:periplasmic nitrate reductase NapE [Shewanella halifaxensis HAW-EB4]|uniref:Periplasmic nitrate reductase NapE n=1 Tax=Shewanella halifaxensis (strain HAW-EB4) TaxID=458817 RepID=B0TSK5_SHEHH|nr:periplasmic nitrate reductase, NapE protein [Shewanella halifaxensis]ABZ77959.1 periplasmic nitrate reductase NapE [Shewanella halifaxensis HAW-EB4]
MTEQSTQKNKVNTKRDEIRALCFIIFLLFPVLSATLISAYGLITWISLTLTGIPSH